MSRPPGALAVCQMAQRPKAGGCSVQTHKPRWTVIAVLADAGGVIV